jgi:hypothetical protein
MDDDALRLRAFLAYFRSRGATAPVPANDSGTEEYADKYYVVLRNVNGPLAVYRIYESAGTYRLRGLRVERWPAGIE